MISNYAGAGPPTLWAIQELIDDLRYEATWREGLPELPELVLPKLTRYDNDPVLRKAYSDAFRKGYADAWDQKETLPVFGPTSDVDKARVFGYGDGSLNGRAARTRWSDTNSQPIIATNKVGTRPLNQLAH